MSQTFFELTLPPASAADVAANTAAIAANTAAIALKADLTQTTTTTALTSYTIQASDNGKELLFTAATTVTVTIPDTIVPAANSAFNCTLVQEGAGQLSFTVSGTQVLKKPAAFVSKSREQESVVGLKIYSATKCRLSGDLAFV